MYWVYILYSPTLNKFYKGQTKDLNARVFRHQHNWERFTKSASDWELVWASQKPNRTQALQLESKLKNLNRVRTNSFIFKYKEDLVLEESLVKTMLCMS